MQLKQWREAVGVFQKTLANLLYRTPENAFYYMGVSYYRLGEYEKAVDAFKDAIRRDRSFVLPYYGMALAYNKLEKYGDAAGLILTIYLWINSTLPYGYRTSLFYDR